MSARPDTFFVGICGNIGVGKSAFARLLGERTGWPVYYEPVAENPFLEAFYADMKRWAFHLQIYLLAERFKAQKNFVELRQPFIQDRTIYEDGEIFARVLHERGAMEPREFDSFLALFRQMVELLPFPGLLLYLKARPESLVARISARGRACEAAVTAAYLEQLDRAYREWIASVRGLCPIVEIDTEAIEFPPERRLIDRILAQIEAAHTGRSAAVAAQPGRGEA
ncbi:MAG: deoxynucleoside kinase [Candidatus Eisenbacteria bacterium]